MDRSCHRSLILSGALAAALAGAPLGGQEPAVAGGGGPPVEIRRATGPIEVDGRLDDPGWLGAARVETWFEIDPADNTPPAVANVAYLAYDDRFFYAAFDFADPDPARIRAPYAERDNVPASTDYGGVYLDTRNDRRTAQVFLANPRGIQYDAVMNDAVGLEDASPDYFWDAAARIGEHGWRLEMRIPFSSLRYGAGDPQTWGVLLYRNHPRAYRYQYASARRPRGGFCVVCNANELTGLAGLPGAGHLVAAPFLTARQVARPAGGLGGGLETEDPETEPGLDLKWTPNPDLALDATLNPDFSQVESDQAQIAANERFALFFPEKRPFFIEGIDLFSTPLRAVYTRSITAPRWGARATGKRGDTAYTALVAEDRGGGLAILPGPQESSFAFQDFESTVAVGRLRHDLGRSFLSFLGTVREIAGGGHNRVFGPDFQWRPTPRDTVTGQLLWSDGRTPERPELAAEWDGRRLASHAGMLWWFHSTSRVNSYVEYVDVGREFRADAGFLPQVGYRSGFTETGYTFRPTGFLRQLRPFVVGDYRQDAGGNLLFSQVSAGIQMNGGWNSYLRVRYAFDELASGAETFERGQVRVHLEASPTGTVTHFFLQGFVGGEVDFANHRLGDGGTLLLAATVRPTDRLELRLNADRRWLDVRAGDRRGRLFTARVERLRATYSFSSRAFLRLIGQWVTTERDPTLYTFDITPTDGGFAGSALFAYKLNWQTVLFLGYGDERTLVAEDRLEPSGRELFLKVSYAFQR